MAPAADRSDGEGAQRGAHPWQERKRPLRLERRVVFGDYDALRDFLDQVAELSEQTGIFPNLSFGRAYANLTLFADDGADALDRRLHDFAGQVDALLGDPSEEDGP